MEVTVDLAGGKTETVRLDGGTYGDLLREVGLSPQAATVLVDGRPVPADAAVDATEVQVLRLISGGADDAGAAALRIDTAHPDEAEAVIAVLDAAMLAFDRARIREHAGTADVLVARLDGRIRGAALLDGHELTAIAVERPVRDQGIGSALVAAAVDARGRIHARFDGSVWGFYESLDFDIAREGDRFRGETATPIE